MVIVGARDLSDSLADEVSDVRDVEGNSLGNRVDGSVAREPWQNGEGAMHVKPAWSQPLFKGH